ncbi:MAG: hypothetical protein ACK496_11290, partial [Acidobacteriota bacterium]
MRRLVLLTIVVLLGGGGLIWPGWTGRATRGPVLRVGAAEVVITPFGKHPDWKGSIASTGVWG